MSKNIENQNIQKQDDWFRRFAERVKKEPRLSPEELAAIKAERDKIEPAKIETALMSEDGTITVRTNQHGLGIACAIGGYTIKPGEEGYEENLKKYSRLKPGRGQTIVRKLVDGKWIEQESNYPDFEVS